MQFVENGSVSFLLFGTAKQRVLQWLGGLNSRLEENSGINECGARVFQTAPWEGTLPRSLYSACHVEICIEILSKDKTKFHVGFQAGGQASVVPPASFLENCPLPAQFCCISGVAFLSPVSHSEGFKRAFLILIAFNNFTPFRKLSLESHLTEYLGSESV